MLPGAFAHLLHFLSLDYEFPDDVTNETYIEALVTYITFTSFLSYTRDLTNVFTVERLLSGVSI